MTESESEIKTADEMIKFFRKIGNFQDKNIIKLFASSLILIIIFAALRYYITAFLIFLLLMPEWTDLHNHLTSDKRK